MSLSADPIREDLTPNLDEFVKLCHARGIRVKLYFTTRSAQLSLRRRFDLALTTPAVLVRELSNRAAELFALRSLPRHEILRPGPGGGGSWLQEHLGEDYLVAWSTVGYAPEAGGFHGLDPQLPGVRGDEAVADSGYSRCATTSRDNHPIAVLA